MGFKVFFAAQRGYSGKAKPFSKPLKAIFWENFD